MFDFAGLHRNRSRCIQQVKELARTNPAQASAVAQDYFVKKPAEDRLHAGRGMFTVAIDNVAASRRGHVGQALSPALGATSQRFAMALSIARTIDIAGMQAATLAAAHAPQRSVAVSDRLKAALDANYTNELAACFLAETFNEADLACLSAFAATPFGQKYWAQRRFEKIVAKACENSPVRDADSFRHSRELAALGMLSAASTTRCVAFRQSVLQVYMDAMNCAEMESCRHFFSSATWQRMGPGIVALCDEPEHDILGHPRRRQVNAAVARAKRA